MTDCGRFTPREHSDLIPHCLVHQVQIFTEKPDYFFATTNSSRRFLALPSSVALDAIGFSCP